MTRMTLKVAPYFAIFLKLDDISILFNFHAGDIEVDSSKSVLAIV